LFTSQFFCLPGGKKAELVQGNYKVFVPFPTNYMPVVTASCTLRFLCYHAATIADFFWQDKIVKRH
jgi:hypothetical protein